MEPRPPYVVGLDLSLTATGIATAGPFSIAAHFGRPGISKLPLADRIDAIDHLVAGAMDRIQDPWACMEVFERTGLPEPTSLFDAQRNPDLVVIEAPDTSSRFGALPERLGYYHLIVKSLVDAEIPVASHPSAILKGYATGKGSTGKLGKAPIKEAVAQYWPQYGTVTDDNECDAIVLAQMGLEWLTGASQVPEKHRDWLLHKSKGRITVVWPETSWEKPL